MAKEMMIVFVYDTQCCTEEEDDPADAVLYFHPGWVSDTQRHALAGQVVGTAHCVKSLFSQPVAITLQSGKFIIREYGRYILAIGSDRNIPDWVLKNRANLLTSMIKVYHGDLNTVAAMFSGEKNTRFSEKLYQMFETYLPVLQFGCHIFQRVPMLTLPKSATSIYLEAMDILNHCRKSKGVLGGVILYNNKIIATTLPPSLTSYLTVVDPYRIKSPAESVQGEVPLPLGVQLLYVYVDKKTHEQMVKQNRAMWEFTQSGEEIIAKFKKNQELEREKLREFPQTGMKRDKSLLFTAVPEEDHNLISPPVGNNQLAEECRRLPAMPDVVPFTNKPRPRPNKLSLSFKNQKSLDEEIKENDEKVFTGQTSVCSTPMVEYKRLHGNVLSICQQNPESTSQVEEKLDPDMLKTLENSAKVNLQKEMRDNKVLLDINCIGEHFINKPDPIRKTASISEIHETFKRISSRASARFKLRKSNTERDETPSPERKPEIHNMTINDPSFPVFRSDGVEISESLFNQYLKQRYTQLKEQDLSKEDNMFTFNRKLYEQEKFEGFDSDMTKSPQRTPKKVPKDSSKTVIDQSRRKSLSLPLKSLSESTDSGSESEVSGFKKKLSGVQLTPLMEKLSHLAFSDKSSGYSSRVMTPLELRDFTTPCVEKQVAFGDRSKAEREESDSEDEDTLPWFGRHSERTALFVSGLQNMAMMLLLDHQQLDPQTIHAMWELSLNALGPIEQKCMDLPPTTEGSEYSYLTLDPDWGTVSKGGPWASLDIATMGLIHSEFCDDTDLTEFMLRSEESVVLGLACGGAHVYYGERQAGLSHDALHAAGTRARRRLARDHAVLTL